MEKTTCKSCKHFRQHYIRYGRSYREAHCGHCVYPRVKQRAPDNIACANYEKKMCAKPEAVTAGR